MSFANRFNVSSLKFNYEIPEGHKFQKPSDLATANDLDKVYEVRSIYINKKGKYGDEPVIVTTDCLLNAPQHMVEVCQQIIQDEKAIEDINGGKVGIQIYEYEHEEYGKQHSLSWVDID